MRTACRRRCPLNGTCTRLNCACRSGTITRCGPLCGIRRLNRFAVAKYLPFLQLRIKRAVNITRHSAGPDIRRLNRSGFCSTIGSPCRVYRQGRQFRRRRGFGKNIHFLIRPQSGRLRPCHLAEFVTVHGNYRGLRDLDLTMRAVTSPCYCRIRCRRRPRIARPWLIGPMPAISVIVAVIVVITVIIRQRIPINAAAPIRHYDQCRPPDTSAVSVMAVRRPVPVIVVPDPSAVMVCCPSPRFVIYPCPAVRSYPAPFTVTIRRPVRI